MLFHIVVVRTTCVVRSLNEPLRYYVHHAAACLTKVADGVRVATRQVWPGDGAEAEGWWVERKCVEK